MMYDFFNNLFATYPRKSHRALEILPPLTSVLLITMPIWGSLLIPTLLTYFIIFFDIYWFYKSVNLVANSYVAAKRIKKAEKTDWFSQAQSLPHFSKVGHIVVMPNYKEKIEKVRETLETLKNQTFPLKRMYVVIAMEEREQESKEKANILGKEYKHIFGELIFTFHPDIPSEVKGKSSNEAFAAREVHRILIEQKKLDIDYLTISSVDADSLFDKQYFSYLTYMFLASPARYLRFWQSANVNYSNFWKIPAFTRIISFFGSLWRTSLLVQGLRLIPNSTYSLSFKLLKEIGYWDTDVIPEDYRIFFKAFFKTLGRVETEPIYLKTSMDAPQSPTYFRSLINKYEQERRWSWGISDDALYLKWYFTVKGVPFLKKTYIVSNVLMDHILWPVNWYIITIAANVVALVNPIYARTTLGYNLPRLSGFILTLCLITLFAMVFIDFSLRSKEENNVPLLRKILFLPQFILMPVAGFFLSSLPALISHIQLIRGKKMDYKVTEKV